MDMRTTSQRPRLSRWLLTAALVLTLVLPGAARAASLQNLFNNAPPSFADLAEQVDDAVVNISTTQVVKGQALQPFLGPDSPFKDFFGDDLLKRFFGDAPQGEMKTHALGSGTIIDANGLILTNNHVVEKATEIKVKTRAEKEYDAEVVGRDPKSDLALIRVKPDAHFPKPSQLGDSDAIRVGDWVIAVGNPFGLGNTVTSGIISAKGRVIGAGPYDDFLQTDAAINPGNSGGPLYNMQGEVVGINTAIVAQGQGIGFAIPINVAKELLPQLKSGKVVRGWLGVAIQDVTPDLAKAMGIKANKGVLVGDVVEGGPAEQSGLKRGDVVVRFDGKEVENAHTFSSAVANTKPGTKAKLEVLRDGATKTINLTIGTMPEESTAKGGGSPGKNENESEWGVTVRAVTPELAQRFGWKENERGVVVADVVQGSPASDAGLKPGDLIKEVNRKRIASLSDFRSAMGEKASSVLLLVKRGEHTFYVALRKDE